MKKNPAKVEKAAGRVLFRSAWPVRFLIPAVISLLTAAFLGGAPAAAADPPQVLDVLPAEGEVVQSTVVLTVYARCEEGATYRFEYMGGYDDDWLRLGEAAEVSRQEGVAEAVYQWDTTLLPDGNYLIRAVVTDSAGTAEGPLSEVYEYRTLLVNNDPSVPVPANLQATVSETDDPQYYAITLTWECSAPDVEYLIYWVDHGYWWHSAPPGSISFERWFHPASEGYNYRFKVRAVDFTGVEGEFTPEITVHLPNPSDADPPVLASAAVTGKSLLLTFNEILDHGSVPAAVDFSVKVDGGAATVESVAVSDSTVILTLAAAVGEGQEVTIDYVPGANPIRDPTGNKTVAFMDQAVANHTDTTPPGAPVNVAALATGSSSVNLTWDPAVDNFGVASYAVYRGMSPEGPFDLVETLDGPVGSYLDTNLTRDTTYYYYVKAGDAAGNWSGPSNTASVTTSDTEQPSAPGNLRAAFALSGSKVVLKWDPAADNFGVVSYAVYRSEASGGLFENLGSLDGSTSTYVDAALTAATTYYYYVTAVDAAGNSSGPSNTAVATKNPALAATICISVTPHGSVGERGSSQPAASAGGRYVSFTSDAENLVAGDANRQDDIFVRDTVTGQTRLVSAAADGTQGNGPSCQVSSISLDGRYVAFESWASNLVPGDTNNKCDIFIKDMETGYISRVSVATGGAEGNGGSRNPAISADGRYIAFESDASNLVPGDTNGAVDIFVHDRLTGVTKRVSVNSSGEQATGDINFQYSGSRSPSINADGRYVAFVSLASNLVPGDTNGFQDVFLHDLETGATSMVSKRGDVLASGHSFNPSLSADGRYISFESGASNLVDGDTNNCTDIFVYERVTGQLSLVSVGSDGSQGDYDSYDARISADGRFVAFESRATNLVTEDTDDWEDTFLHDRLTGETLRVSVSSGGTGGDQFSHGAPSISPDGGYVAFTNYSGNLVPDDDNWEPDVFLRGPLLPADTGPPSVPGNVAAAAAGFSQARIDWDASTDNVWVMGYFVYRAVAPEGPFAFIGSTSSGTGFLDTGLAPNATYYYQVAAYDAAGNFSGPSEVVSASTALSPPEVLEVQPDDGVVQGVVNLAVKAKCQAGASFRFEYKGSGDEDWTFLGEAAETSREEGVSTASYRWDTTGIEDGSYALRAVVTDAVGSGESAEPRTLYVNNDPAVPVPGTLSAQASQASDPRYYDLTLSWVTQGMDVAGHELYWSYEGEWRELATVSGGERAYTHRVRPGETGYSYRFRVRAFDYAGARGEFSSEVEVIIPPPPGGDVQRPQVVAIFHGDGSAIGPGVLPFNITVTDNGEIRAVYLQYSTDGVNWTPINSPETYIDPPSGDDGFWSAVRSWQRDETLASGGYYVRAAAEDAGGNIGYLTSRYEIFDLYPPREVQYEPQQDGSLKISWLRSSWLVETSCEIYRAEAAGGPFEKIATKNYLYTWPPLPDDWEREANQYIDSGLDRTKRYYYKLREVKFNPYRYSRFTGTYTHQAFDQSTPPAVQVFPGEDETSGLAVVRWDPVPGADFYRVFRAESPEAEPALIAEVSQPGPDGKWSYRDTGLDQTKWYYYRVQGCTTSPPLSGPLSAAVGVKPSVRPPVLTVDKDLWEIGGTKGTLTGTVRDPVGVAGVRASGVIDGVAYHYYGEVSGESWSVEVDLKSKTELTFSIFATDTDGNQTWPPLGVTVRSLDWTPPGIGVGGLAEGQVTNAVPGFMVTFADQGLGLDLNSISITIDDRPVPRTHDEGNSFYFRTWCAIPASGYLGKGSHTLRVTVRDQAGYETELLRHFTVDYPPLAVGLLDWTRGVTTPDRQLACVPEAVLRLPYSDGSGTGVTFSGQLKDLLQPSRPVLFETRPQSGLIEIAPAEPLPYGPYELNGELRNGVGESVQFTRTFLCYTDPPLVEINQPADGEELAFGTYFEGRVADRSLRGLQSWEATLNGQPLTGISLDREGRFSIPQELPPGEYTFRLKAVENASGRTSSIEASVKVSGQVTAVRSDCRGWNAGSWKWWFKVGEFDRAFLQSREEGIPLVVNPLVTNRVNGGRGFSATAGLTVKNPETGEVFEKEIDLKNFAHQEDPAFSWGADYPTHSLTMVPGSMLSTAGEMEVTLRQYPGRHVEAAKEHAFIGYPAPYIHAGRDNWSHRPAYLKPYYGETVEESPVVILAYITDDTGTGIGEVRLEVDGVQRPFSRSSKAGDVEITCALDLPRGEHTATLTAVNGLGISTTARTVFNVSVGSTIPWMEVQRGGDTYKVFLSFSRDLSESEQAAIKGRYFSSSIIEGAALKQVSVRRVTDSGVELVTDSSLAKEILLAAMRGAYYRDHVPGSEPQVDQALVDWVNYWRDNWGYGLLAGLCPDRPQPPSKSEVHKAIIAAALAGGDTPSLLSDELNNALSFYSTALGGAKTVADVREKLADWKVLAKSSSRAVSVCNKVVKGLSYVDEATQLTKEMMETIFLAYWQASAIAEYRDNLLRIQPYVTDVTLRAAIDSLVSFDPDVAYDIIDRKIGEYFAQKAEEEVRDYLKDVLFEINPILGAAMLGLDVGFFIAQFTGWEQAYVCNHQASHEAAAESGTRPPARRFGTEASLGLGKMDFQKVTDATVAAKLNLFAASRFYSSVATLSSLFKNYPSLGQHAQYEAVYRQESSVLLAKAKSAVPGLASSTRDYFDLAGKLTKQNLAVGTLVVNAYSPVTIVVTDPLGRRTGCDQYGNLLSEIPGATYNGPEAEPQEIRITNPLPGQYRVNAYSTVQGGGEAPYKIVVATTETDGTVISAVYREGTAVAGGMDTIDLTSNGYGDLTQGGTPFTLGNLVCNPDTVTAGATSEPVTPARLEFEISREALVWVDVEDLSGSTIASLVAGEPRAAGKVTVYWNGRDALDRPVADGAYRFAVRAEDSEGATLSGQAQVRVSVPPAVSGSDPADGAAGVPVDTAVTVRFNEEVREGGSYGGISVKDNRGNAVPFTVSFSGGTLTLKPVTRFSHGTAYAVTVPAGAVRDIAGNLLAAAYTFTFTTNAAPGGGGISTGGSTPPAVPESLPPKPAPPVFTDMAKHWAAEAVSKLAGMKVVGGYPGGTFRPEKHITRAEIAAILARALKLEPGGEHELHFEDSAKIPAWARGAVAAAAKEGLVRGYLQPGGGLNFEAERPVTRTELAVLAARIIEKKLGPVSGAPLFFSDAGDIPAWARQALGLVVAEGIIGGYPDKTFRASNYVTRAEAAVVILRLLDSLQTGGR